MNPDEFCRQLELRLQGLPSGPARVAEAVRGLQQAFGVGTDAIALVALKGTVLNFLWPEKLQKVGFIPLNSHDSLVARTVRENRGFVHNRFATARHAGVFEMVQLDQERKEKPRPIQKILSVPLPGADGTVKGAVQVSRKGAKDDPALPDFTPQDLAFLGRLATILGPSL